MAVRNSNRFEISPGPSDGVKKIYYVFSPPAAGSSASASASHTATGNTAGATPFKVKVELLTFGEFGPRDVTPASGNTIEVRVGSATLPLLTPTQFIREKVKTWARRGLEKDIEDIHKALIEYEHELDFTRINPNNELEDLLQTEESDSEETQVESAHVKGIREIYERLRARHHA